MTSNDIMTKISIMVVFKEFSKGRRMSPLRRDRTDDN